MQKISVVLVILLNCFCLFGQTDTTKNDESVKTIDGIVNEMLDIISGDTSEIRDWEAFKSLFTPNATFSTTVHGKSVKSKIKTYTIEEFVKIGEGFYQANGFEEYELKKIVNQYNGIAQVFQSYVAQFPTGEQKGVNSYQLIYDGERWWITSVVWVSNSNGVELPKELE